MTIHAWPLDAVDGSPAYHGRSLRLAGLAPLMPGATATRPLGGVSCVRPGTPDSVLAASSTQVTLHPHAGQIDIGLGLSGPYGYAVEADEQVALSAAHASYTRWDLAYLTLNDPAEGGTGSAPEVTFHVAVGTAAASPADPAVPSDAHLVLGRVVVPPAGTGDPSVVWLAPRMAGADGVPHFATASARDAAVPSPWAGQAATTGSGSGLSWWVHDGSQWEQLARLWRAAGDGDDVVAGGPWPSGSPLLLQVGSAVISLDVNGYGSITWPRAFPSGLIGFVAFNGDGAARPNGYIVPGTATSGSVQGHIRMMVGAAAVGSGQARVNYIAAGW
ncbi:hypothetical protein GCM10009785_26640 [Brooklawnia cerclae]|uniref:Phage tail protein n=1 Tax=Brooklawnia cerclae TaxID=349934 RepID=A0ABX0SG19_9ACTN|nr:hypothetical protein [Brooklawnia cerclae]NIH57327.1 hypothetical protein [Brooklawnia cerclae]